MRCIMDKPFCRAPWTTIQYSGTFGGGGVSPCCEWRGEKFTGAISDYESSEYLAKIRQAMLDHDQDFINENCSECLETEALGDQSARNFIDRDLNSGRYTFGKINKIDYRPDNLCNLKCRMCSVHSSSLIEEEFVKHGFHEPIEQRPTDDVVDFDLNHLQEIAVLGGEPTVNKRVWNLLDQLIEKGKHRTTRLNYTTNCTSVNDQWMSRMRQFDLIHVNLSLDAAGKAYEYIRTGAEWHKVEQNVPHIIEPAEDYLIQMVVQINSFAIIEDWFEYFLQFPSEYIRMTSMQGVPGKLDCIPDHIKQQKIAYLEKFNHPTAQQAIKHFEMYEYNPQEVERYKKYNGWLDSIRGTDVRDLDPVFEEILSYQAA